MDNQVVEDCATSKKRDRSSSPSSDSSSSSERESQDSRPRKKVRLEEQTVSYAHFELLSQQVAFLTDLILRKTPSTINSNNNNETDCAGFQHNNELKLRPPSNDDENAGTLKLSELKTTVKDPVYGHANDHYLTKLKNLQRFNSSDWYAIRFAEIQKKYLATPGFIELSVNDALKRFEAAMLRDDPRSYLLERSFAGLTNAILSQKDELQKALQSLVDWAMENRQTLSPNSIFNKIESLFSNTSPYNVVTDDILQIVCGRRADFISMRRDSLLRQIPEEFHREVLIKIPPSIEMLFDDESVQNYVQKIGGVDKLISQPRSGPPTNFRDNFYRDQKPSTSKQGRDAFFRQNPSAKRGRQLPRPHNQTNKDKANNARQKIKRSRPSFKNKRD